MPRTVYLVALSIFAMVSSEFAVAGLLQPIGADLHVSIPQVGYLITAYALAMSLGGPVLSILLLRLPPKTALVLLSAAFILGNSLAAIAPGYGLMLVARVITGATSAAFFGVSLSVCGRLVAERIRGRAVGTAMNGFMLGTLLGLPLATLVGDQLGWRMAFWVITALNLLALIGLLIGVPKIEAEAQQGGLAGELRVFRSGRLWLALSTSMLIIGATMTAFSYFRPILMQVTGFSEGAVPVLLLAYGSTTVLGNLVVGRLADTHAMPVLAVGLTLNIAFLAAFALLADLRLPAVLCLLGIGLVGITLNPAMFTRVQRVGNTGPLVNTVHTSCVTFGIVIGSAIGGLAIDAFGLRAPLWLGAALAALGLLSLLPEVTRTRVPA
ncbi:MFS transporter [Pseudonocardiaceae bacterium YIM PH 21723]|nr:MFS transporter [Pseudonocardiaceae bacterium YIM PH 21723]